ncbi:hypothetical protein QR680_008781 [Steinernema hermaphroditum]|uniref:Importin subunit alpha n=1 Tax=Steinernema hermaphroditum TaxID=289476 RepID=A0AA39M8I7_9BILA|nr:hypothetical protein QR680_008781 [Steinernema hermaphroditum]
MAVEESFGILSAIIILESRSMEHLWSDAYLYLRQHLMKEFSVHEELEDRLIAVTMRGLRSEDPSDAWNCAWSLTNLSCDGKRATDKIVAMGAIESLGYVLLNASDRQVRDQCMWALGNIACENEDLARRVACLGPVPVVIAILQEAGTSFLIRKQCVWFLGQVLQYSAGLLSIDLAKTLSKTLIDEVFSVFSMPNWTRVQDRHAKNVFHLIAQLVDVFRGPVIDLVLDYRHFLCELIVSLNNLLAEKPYAFRKPAMQVIGNLLLGDDAYVERLFEFGFSEFLYNELQKFSKVPSPGIAEVLWMYSNIAATNERFVHEAYAGDGGELIGEVVVTCLQSDNKHLVKEASYAAINTLTIYCDSEANLEYFLDAGYFLAIVRAFVHRCERFVEPALEVLEMCLKHEIFKQKCLAYELDVELESMMPWVLERQPLLAEEVTEVIQSLRCIAKEKQSDLVKNIHRVSCKRRHPGARELAMHIFVDDVVRF